MLGAIDAFRGTRRFVVEGKLGEGGMGVVHRARDVERHEIVALKTMTRLDPSALLRFKREFRALADITHPNVVQLYELISEGDLWFFTMELVDGCDLLAWVHSSLSTPPPPLFGATRPDGDRPGSESGEHPTLLAPTEAYDELVDGMSRRPPPNANARPGIATARARFAIRDVPRLRAGFRQLAAGVSAIHAAGKLHRDIKPSNVMVTRAGRVVLLDFGVVGEFSPGKKPVRNEEPLVGTPAYMAPEQAAFQAATPASDWYAVGVILFEALTRRMPFEGSTSELLIAKQRPLASRPSELVEGIPEDLEQLCVDLLTLDPRARPTADEVLRRLEGERAPRVLDVGRGSVRRANVTPRHLARRVRGDERVGAGRRHASRSLGHGKSALASRFLGEAAARSNALVLTGRCYEREAVPFKAVDQIVDELSRWLARLPEDEAYTLLPGGIHALARLFPVMRDPRVVAAAPDIDADVADPLQMRQRAFVAMRELFASIAATRPVVLHIDDLQWGDADSVQLLEALLSPPAPHPLLLVCGHRTELAASSEALAALRGAWGRLSSACDIREVEVAELSNAEAFELARALVDSADPSVPESIAIEARGSPFFVAELARWANERREVTRGDEAIALEQVILARVAELPPDARALLETISVAGTPLEHVIAEKAQESSDDGRSATLALRGARFVSTRGLRDADMLQTSHDRIRETVAANLGEEDRRARHLALAHAIASFDHADPEGAFVHFRAAGDESSARDYALRAAEAADQALAFSRAAGLYRAAIALGASAADILYAKLGDALANAGRGADAADAYLEAAERATERDGGDLRRTAAEHYLKSGLEERGLEVLRRVLVDAGLRYPETTEATIASLVWHEARVRVSSLVRSVRRPQSLSRRDLARCDAAFAAATGLALTDILRSADFATRALLIALETGEPVRLGRALAIAAGNVAARGEGGRKRADDLVRAAERVALQVDDPHGRALAMLAAGFVHFFLGEWRSARTKLEEADAILRTHCRAVAWELASTQAWTCNVLILSGELREASRRIPGIVEEARARDDRFALMNLTYPACCAHIVADDVDAAWRVTELASKASGGAFTAFRWGRSSRRARSIGTRAMARRRGGAPKRSPLRSIRRTSRVSRSCERARPTSAAFRRSPPLRLGTIGHARFALPTTTRRSSRARTSATARPWGTSSAQARTPYDTTTSGRSPHSTPRFRCSTPPTSATSQPARGTGEASSAGVSRPRAHCPQPRLLHGAGRHERRALSSDERTRVRGVSCPV